MILATHNCKKGKVYFGLQFVEVIVHSQPALRQKSMRRRERKASNLLTFRKHRVEGRSQKGVISCQVPCRMTYFSNQTPLTASEL